MTKEDEMNIINELDQKNNKKQRKFPMIIPSMAKIKMYMNIIHQEK